MLSTRLGYGRPARSADAFAFALLLVFKVVCRLWRGAGFFQGCILVFVAIIADSLPVLFREVADRTRPILNVN